MFNNKTIKILSFVFVFLIIFSPVLSRKAEAQWVVWDPGNFAPNWGSFIKDYALDGLAWSITNLIIDRLSASTVKWINSGFNGSPGYIQNSGQYFQNLGDGIAGQYIFSNPNLNFLCGPISAKVKIALSTNYSGSRNIERWQCTLSEVGSNLTSAFDDYYSGDWNEFFAISQNRQNNPLGAYLQAESELFSLINTQTENRKTELQWGKGFLPSSECVTPGIPYTKVIEDPGRFELQPDGSNVYVPGERREVQEPGPCLEERTVTPGTVIENKLNEVLGLGNNRLVAADEFNEIVSALLNQLMGRVLGAGRGLFGTSQSDPSSSQPSLVSQLDSSTSTSTKDYFGKTQDTSILDAPPPDPTQSPTGGTLVSPPAGQTTQTCNPNTEPFCP